MKLGTHQKAHRRLLDNSNMGGNDYNTGSLLAIPGWIERYIIYAVDLTRQEAFEANPNVSRQIRIRGTPSAAGALKVYIFENKRLK